MWPTDDVWAAASLVEIGEEGIELITPLSLIEGAPESPLRLRSESEQVELVAVERAALVPTRPRADSSRLHESRIAAKTRATCGASGEIEGGLVSFSLGPEDLRDGVKVYREVNGVYERRDAPEWLETLQIETPAVDELRCSPTAPFRLVAPFGNVFVLPLGARVAGRELSEPNTLVRNLELIPDGRFLAITGEALMLRGFDEPYVDDPRKVLRLFDGVREDYGQERNDFVLLPGGGQSEGEVLYSAQDADRRTRLRTVRFDADGFLQPELLSELPGTARLRRLLRDPSGLLVALMDDGNLIYTERLADGWAGVEVGADGRMLMALPGRPRAFIVGAQNVLTVVEFSGAGTAPTLTRIAELTTSVLFDGDIVTRASGALDLVISGRSGELFTREGIEPNVPWRLLPLSTIAPSGHRCLSAPVCGLQRLDVWLRSAAFADSGGEPFILISAEFCREPFVLRPRDNCLEPLELDPSGISESDRARMQGGEARSFVKRAGRVFSLGSLGTVLEVIPR